MEYLFAAEVLVLHARIIQRTGGSGGVLSIHRPESALARPQAAFGSEELYPDVWWKAAALLHSLIGNHPSVDGNKRTAFGAGVIFLELNGQELAATNDEALDFMRRVITRRLDVPEIATWLRAHSRTETQRRGASSTWVLGRDNSRHLRRGDQWAMRRAFRLRETVNRGILSYPRRG